MNLSDIQTLISNDEHRELELKKSTGELKDAMEGGFVTFKRKSDTQDVPQGVPQGVPQDVHNTIYQTDNDILQDDTQDDTQGDTQEKLDNWIEAQLAVRPKITTEELANLSGKSVITIKRHIAKMPHIKYIGSGYSGHWEISKK